MANTAPSTTFDKIEAHLAAQPLHAMAPGSSLHFTSADVRNDPATVITKLCGAYQMVKPIIGLIQGLWLVPQRWKDAIKAFQSLMDTLCPGA